MDKQQQAIEILREKMTDDQFWEYAQGFISMERITDEITDYLSNIADEQELDEFISKYNN